MITTPHFSEAMKFISLTYHRRWHVKSHEEGLFLHHVLQHSSKGQFVSHTSQVKMDQ